MTTTHDPVDRASAEGSQERTGPPSWLVPAVVAAAAVGVVALVAPGVLLGMLTSPRALLLLALVVAGFVLVSRLAGRYLSHPAARAVVLAVPAAVLVALVVVPSVRDVQVDEALPDAAPVPAPPAAAPLAAVEETEAAAATGQEDADASAAPPAPEPAGPVELGRAPVAELDYRATGQAVVLTLEDGSTVVRLEDLDVQPGPDYDVYLVPGAGAESPGDGVFLDDLRGNVGSSNYPVPSDVDVSTPLTVLIWCTAFGLPVANASIA